MESAAFRNNPLFLRNEFNGIGVFDMPLIQKQKHDLDDLKLMGYDKTKENDQNNKDKYIHFFLDDYKFESLWKAPEPRFEKLQRYKGILSPQYSIYTKRPLSLHIYNIFRSRWVGAWYQKHGIQVIPTVYWGMPQSYWFCFDGIEKGSVVATSTIGLRKEKDFFLQGYQEMLRRIEPEIIICYGEPFDEMQGKVLRVDYAITNHLESPHNKSSIIRKTSGYLLPICDEAGIVESRAIMTTYLKTMEGYVLVKGSGSARGGFKKTCQWQRKRARNRYSQLGKRRKTLHA